MRIRLLLLLASLFPGVAWSQEWCDAPICAQLEGSDTVRILAPGDLEATFTKREGFGAEVYDLQADPDKLYDLSALTINNGILWTNISEVGDSTSYFANNATTLEILESEGLRVQVRHSGKHHRYGNPGTPWDDLGFEQTFTVYATGEVYVDYTLIASRDIPLRLFNLIVKTTGDWGSHVNATAPGEGYCVGEFGLGLPYASTASSFAMMASDGVRYYADLLMTMYDGVHYGSAWNEGFQAVDFRCGLKVRGVLPDGDVPEGVSHVPIMMRIGQDMNDAAGAMKYADDYRNPDAALAVLQGVKVLTDPGDRDGDGFNEEDGSYVLQRQGSQDVEFVLHGDRPRMNPAFKILDWDEPGPPDVWIDGLLGQEGVQYSAAPIGSVLIVQLLGERTADTEVLVQSSATKVPALTPLGGFLLVAALAGFGARRLTRAS